jgi:wyosine [tRNA(Phe)-imidazoG37] synthetase (radical SAM superfamily)
MNNYLFGPVPSRRLGRSLGVDLIPFKTCTYDCIYCQLGSTTRKTLERREWVPLETVLREVEDKLVSRPDYITLSGSGEPTLFRPLDKLIEAIHDVTDVPVAVLTNGSLLGMSEVQTELSQADLVIPSLDAGSDAAFQSVNRPHQGISFARMLAGLVRFRRRFRQPFWLEVFLVAGYNDTEQELAGIRRCVQLVQPDRVQLNTVTRPPAQERARAVPRARLDEIAATFSPPAEVIAEFHSEQTLKVGETSRQEILQLLRRRPCSIEDMVEGLAMHRNEVLKSMEHLASEGQVVVRQVGDTRYFKATAP